MSRFKKRKSISISNERNENAMPFTVLDCTREQLIELKLAYLSDLVNAGVFGEVFGCDYDEPSYADVANVDDLVPDDVIFDHYDGVTFFADDFWSDRSEQ